MKLICVQKINWKFIKLIDVIQQLGKCDNNKFVEDNAANELIPIFAGLVNKGFSW